MQELIRKKYRLEIEFVGRFMRGKKIYFDFEQAPLRDLIEMRTQINDFESLKGWLYKFLMEKTKQSDKLTLNLFNQLPVFRINSIMEYLFKTYAKDFFKKEKANSTKKSVNRTPESSLICTVLEKTGESVESLMNMTWEQIKYISEGITWNINAQNGKKGHELNQRNLRMKDLEKEFTEEETEQALADLKERMNKRNLKK